MLIKTSNSQAVKHYLQQLKLPKALSHKGQNGRLLIIGGSSLFHSASIWAAEIASHFVDIVHYSSSQENNEIILALKKKFRNGIVVPQKNIFAYVDEDDAVLVGPGMMRGKEGRFTYALVKKLIFTFPNQQFVFDAEALQMMEKEWLLKLNKPAIITPHQQEFQLLFHQTGSQVKLLAREFNTIILLKAIKDKITDGHQEIIVEGGNAGLTKGGTGDLLAGLTAALVCQNLPLISAVSASLLLKTSADKLYREKGFWYNINDLINKLPEVLASFLLFDNH